MTPLAGWKIKANDTIMTPIAIVPETIGGRKNKEGRSPWQQANAAFIVEAVNSHAALTAVLDGCVEALEAIPDPENEGFCEPCGRRLELKQVGEYYKWQHLGHCWYAKLQVALDAAKKARQPQPSKRST
jgi:hypothetical protein